MTEQLPVATVGDKQVSLASAPNSLLEAILTEMDRPLSPSIISPEGATRMLAQASALNARLGARIIEETRRAGRSTVEDKDVDRAVEAITGRLAAQAQNLLTYAVAIAGLAGTWLVTLITVTAIQHWSSWVAFILMVIVSILLIGKSRSIAQ